MGLANKFSVPELPEVQTVASDLNKKIKNYKVVGFWSDWPKAIKNATLEKFTKEIKNRKILGARRIGKNLFLDLSGGKTLYLHLKMTGHLLIKSEKKSQTLPTGRQVSNLKTQNFFDDRVNQYIHHIWKLRTIDRELVNLEFSDMRKFAKIVLVDTDKVSDLPEIKKLGIDAMDPKFTLKKFEELLAKRKNKPIGIVLMEQELIAGIGNIYRSEILFEAGVIPKRKTGSLKKEEIKNIFNWIKKILKKAIEMRGTSDSDYRDTSGAPGQYHKMLKVYRKDKQKCPKCGKIISRTKMAQRSAFFCSKCQK